MESEVYQEYFSRPRNKLALAFWVLINNNLIVEEVYFLMMLLEYGITFLIILCLYNEVGSIPALTPTLISFVDNQSPSSMAILSFVIFGVFLLLLIFLCFLTLFDSHWTLYTEKKTLFQVLSTLVTLIRCPLYLPICLYLINNL